MFSRFVANKICTTVKKMIYKVWKTGKYFSLRKTIFINDSQAPTSVYVVQIAETFSWIWETFTKLRV